MRINCLSVFLINFIFFRYKRPRIFSIIKEIPTKKIPKELTLSKYKSLPNTDNITTTIIAYHLCLINQFALRINLEFLSIIFFTCCFLINSESLQLIHQALSVFRYKNQQVTNRNHSWPLENLLRSHHLHL